MIFSVKISAFKNLPSVFMRLSSGIPFFKTITILILLIHYTSGFHDTVRKISPKTPAAVTLSPAPYPITDKGMGLYRWVRKTKAFSPPFTEYKG